jgi:hypothetical protein
MVAHFVVAVVVLGGHWTMAQPAPCGNSCPIGEELGFPENIRVGQLAENQVTLTLTEFFYGGSRFRKAFGYLFPSLDP